MMGIGIMGTRSIAYDRAKNVSLNSAFSSLMTLSGIATLLALLALAIVTIYVPTLHQHSQMMGYGALKIVSNFFLIEWFYKGIEDFKYITLRTILVKILFVISIFIFVRTQEDYKVYYLLTVLMITANSIINILYSRNFAVFETLKVRLKPYIKPFIMLGIYMLVTSFCTTFNVVYLGFKTNDVQVGYYSTALKLFSILLALFTGVTSVLMPRMSNLLALNQKDEFKNIVAKTSNILLQLGVPLIFLTIIFSPQIVYLISGPGYEGAITPMRIVMPMIIIIGFEQIYVIQCLMPLNKDRIIMINASCGAGLSILINLLIVGKLGSVGSSIAWISSETLILILSQIALFKIAQIKFPLSKLLIYLLQYSPLIIILCLVYYNTTDMQYWVVLIIASLTTLSYFLVIQLLNKNSLIYSLLKKSKH